MNYLLQRKRESLRRIPEIESGGFAEFSHGRKASVRVGKDFIDFHNGNKTDRIDKSRLELIMSEKNDNEQTKITISEKKIRSNSPDGDRHLS